MKKMTDKEFNSLNAEMLNQLAAKQGKKRRDEKTHIRKVNESFGIELKTYRGIGGFVAKFVDGGAFVQSKVANSRESAIKQVLRKIPEISKNW